MEILKKPVQVSVGICALLFIFLSFFSFLSAGKIGPLFYLKLAWSLVVSVFGFCIYRQGEISKYRSILFILIAFFFFLEFKFFRFLALEKTISPYCHIAQSATILSFIHQQYLSLTSGQWQIWGVLSLGFLWLLIIATIGQGICSWVCFYGGIDEACSKIAKKPLIKLNISRSWRDFPLAFLIFLLIISFVQGLPVFCSWFCPFKLTGAFWDSEPLIRGAQAAFFLLSLVVLVIFLPILTKKRTFCGLICPFGALVSVCGKVSPYRVSINKDTCTRCKKCFDACPVFAVEKNLSNEFKISGYCNKCGKCVDICPVSAITMTAGKSLVDIPFEIRDVFIFLSLLITGVISGGFVPQAILRLTGIK